MANLTTHMPIVQLGGASGGSGMCMCRQPRTFREERVMRKHAFTLLCGFGICALTASNGLGQSALPDPATTARLAALEMQVASLDTRLNARTTSGISSVAPSGSDLAAQRRIDTLERQVSELRRLVSDMGRQVDAARREAADARREVRNALSTVR
jgi:uncharacterized protein YceH (UPF0502 family)